MLRVENRPDVVQNVTERTDNRISLCYARPRSFIGFGKTKRSSQAGLSKSPFANLP